MVWSEAIDLLKSTDGSAEKKLPTQQAVKFETGGKKKLTSGEGFPLPGQSIAAPKKETVTERPPLNVRISKILQNEADAKKKGAAEDVKRVSAKYEKPQEAKPNYFKYKYKNQPRRKRPSSLDSYPDLDGTMTYSPAAARDAQRLAHLLKREPGSTKEIASLYEKWPTFKEGEIPKVSRSGRVEPTWSPLDLVSIGGGVRSSVLRALRSGAPKRALGPGVPVAKRSVGPGVPATKRAIKVGGKKSPSSSVKAALEEGVGETGEYTAAQAEGALKRQKSAVAQTGGSKGLKRRAPTVDRRGLGLADTQDAALARTVEKVKEQPGWRDAWAKRLEDIKGTTDLRTKAVSPTMIEKHIIPKDHFKQLQGLASRALKKKYPKGDVPPKGASLNAIERQNITNDYLDFYYNTLSEYLTQAIKNNPTYRRKLQALPHHINKSWAGALDILKSIDDRRNLSTRVNSFSASWNDACDLLKADATEEVPWKAASKMTGGKVFTDSRVLPLKTRPASEETVRPRKKLIETPTDEFDALRIYRAKNPHTGKTLKQELIDAYKDNPDARPTGQTGSIPSWNEKYSRRSGGFLKKYSDPKVSKKAALTVKEPYPVSLEGFDFAPGQSAVVGTKKIPKWVERARLRYQQKLYRTAMRKSHHDMEKSWGIVMTDNWNDACDLLKADTTEEVPWKAENRRAYRLAQHRGDKFVRQQRGVSKITGEKVFTDSRVAPLKTRPASEDEKRIPKFELAESPQSNWQKNFLNSPLPRR